MRLLDAKADRRTADVAVGSPLQIGREADCELILADDHEVSRRHAEIRALTGGAFELRDLGSSNGTYLNGKRVDGARRVSVGDQISVGNTTLTAEETPRTRAARSPSVIERVLVERSLRRVSLLAAGALAVAATGVVLAAAGAFSAGEPPRPSEVIDAVRSSVVRVVAVADGRDVGSGTGWGFDAERGLVVTNAHVIGGGDRVEVEVDGSRGDADVVAVSICDDLAVLELDDADGLETLEVGPQHELEQGERVFAMGFPGNLSTDPELQVTTGTVAVVEQQADLGPETGDLDLQAYPNVIQTDAAINPGNSGGPLVNEAAQLVGVNTLSAPDKQSQGYAIGAEHVNDVLDVLAEGESIGWFGFDFQSQGEGLVIAAAIAGTEASRAGFGDGQAAVVAVNGGGVGTRQDYCRAVDGLDGGDEATLTVVTPDGRARPVDIALE